MAKKKKLTKDIRLGGQYYMQPDGTVYYLYGGWFKYKFAKIPKNSNVFKKIVETYGTKEGKDVRKKALIALLKSGKWAIRKVK